MTSIVFSQNKKKVKKKIEREKLGLCLNALNTTMTERRWDHCDQERRKAEIFEVLGERNWVCVWNFWGFVREWEKVCEKFGNFLELFWRIEKYWDIFIKSYDLEVENFKHYKGQANVISHRIHSCLQSWSGLIEKMKNNETLRQQREKNKCTLKIK